MADVLHDGTAMQSSVPTQQSEEYCYHLVARLRGLPLVQVYPALSSKKTANSSRVRAKQPDRDDTITDYGVAPGAGQKSACARTKSLVPRARALRRVTCAQDALRVVAAVDECAKRRRPQNATSQ
jgi:hypothetical protein